MDKATVLQAIRDLARKRELLRDELLAAYDEGVSQEATPLERLNLSSILYYLGGGIVVLGIAILIGQNWDVLGTITRVLSTLGSGLVASVAGTLLLRQERTRVMGQAFHLIAGLTLPIGLFVSLDQAGYDVSDAGWQSFVYGVLLAFYLFSHMLSHRVIFVLFSSIFGTLFVLGLSSLIARDTALLVLTDSFFAYQMVVIGLSHLLLGYAFVTREERPLTRYLYVLGLIEFLGAVLTLGGWSPEQRVFWELIFPGLALGAILLSVPLKSRAFLILGSLFLIAYIFKITAEYFSDSLGWPLALIIAGFALIGVGTLFVRVNRKYQASIG